jgi:lipooligosaccharide transport system ATP-binding protein
VEVYGPGALQAGIDMAALAKRTETRGETVFFYLDSASAQVLVRALAAYPGLRVLHRPANLEDLFLKLTGRQIRDE